MRSNAFLHLTFDRREIKYWGWSQCVSLAETHRLAYNMTYLDHHVTSPDLDLMSDFDQGLLTSTCICINASRREEHDGVRFSHSFVRSKVIHEKIIWIFLYPSKPNVLKFV